MTDINLSVAIASPAFQQLWSIGKDKIDICKVCEYRYMCNDPRMPAQRKDGAYYYPTECCYNPYIGKWEKEEGYHTLAECGIVCNDATFSIDTILLATIDAAINSG